MPDSYARGPPTADCLLPAVRRGHRPPQGARSPREPAAERDQHRQVTLFDAPRPHRLVQGDWHRRGGGVAITLDVDEKLLAGLAQPFRRRVDDTDIRLLGNEPVDVLDGHMG